MKRRSVQETGLYLMTGLVVWVPSEEFTASTLKRLDTESHEVRNYRLPVQEELDELRILNRILLDYEDLGWDVRSMETWTEMVELLMGLTEKELHVRELQRQYRREFSSK